MGMPLIPFWGLKTAKKKAKIAKIDILNLKLIVPDDYQQFLAHFEWFLALFIFLMLTLELSWFKRKVRKNGIFWAKNLIQKIS